MSEAETPCLMTSAERSWSERNARMGDALEAERQRLFDEFMSALAIPTVGCVSATKGRRYPVLECLFENLAFSKYRADGAAAVAILMRDPAGRAICERMASIHADDYAEIDE